MSQVPDSDGQPVSGIIARSITCVSCHGYYEVQSDPINLNTISGGLLSSAFILLPGHLLLSGQRQRLCALCVWLSLCTHARKGRVHYGCWSCCWGLQIFLFYIKEACVHKAEMIGSAKGACRCSLLSRDNILFICLRAGSHCVAQVSLELTEFCLPLSPKS